MKNKKHLYIILPAGLLALLALLAILWSVGTPPGFDYLEFWQDTASPPDNNTCLVYLDGLDAVYELKKVPSPLTRSVPKKDAITYRTEDGITAYPLPGRDDLVYLVFQEGRKKWIGKFLAGSSERMSYRYGTILKNIYNVKDASGLASVLFQEVAEESLGCHDIPESAKNNPIQLFYMFNNITKQPSIPSRTTAEKVALEEIYRIFSNMESPGEGLPLPDSGKVKTAWNEFPIPEKLAMVLRNIKLSLTSGEVLGFTFDPVEPRMIQENGDSYRSLPNKDVRYLCSEADIIDPGGSVNSTSTNLATFYEEGKLIASFVSVRDDQIYLDYPDYYGGVIHAYTDKEQDELVLSVLVKEDTEKVRQDIIKRVGNDHFILQKVKYSRNELNAMVEEVIQLATGADTANEFPEIKYIIILNLDMENRVRVLLNDYSEENVSRLLSMVSNPDMFVVLDGDKELIY